MKANLKIMQLTRKFVAYKTKLIENQSKKRF